MTAFGPWRREAASDRLIKMAVRPPRLRPVLLGLAGEARQEAALDRATAASEPAHPDRGTALMVRAHAW
jgi:hypothetical protein